jgi:transcriptional regulator with XRE-family HTH domain
MVYRPRNEAQKAKRNAEILRLRVEQGLSLRKIAAVVGLHHVTVMDIINEELMAVRTPMVNEIRRTEDERLDYLLEKLRPGIEDGDVPSIKEARMISESRRKLYGADGPLQVNVEVEHTPAEAEVQQLVADAEAFLSSEERKVYGDRDGD